MRGAVVRRIFTAAVTSKGILCRLCRRGHSQAVPVMSDFLFSLGTAARIIPSAPVSLAGLVLLVGVVLLPGKVLAAPYPQPYAIVEPEGDHYLLSSGGT